MVLHLQAAMAVVALGLMVAMAAPIIALSKDNDLVSLDWNGHKTQKALPLTLDTPGRIQVMDYNNGDGYAFKIYDHHKYLGETSTQNKPLTPEDTLSSSSIFALDAGEHSITLESSSRRSGNTVIRLLLDDHDKKSFMKKTRPSRNRHNDYNHDIWIDGNDIELTPTKEFTWTWEDALAGYDHPLYGHPVDIHHAITSTATVWVDPESTY